VSADEWLAGAGRYPLLTASLEITLGNAVRAWQDHPDGPAAAPPRIRRAGLRARERLVCSNLRLVASACRGWFHRAQSVGLEREDVLQIGAVGLQRAAEKFDPARGYKFSTYATLWITQGVRRVCVEGGLIRTPCRSETASAATRAAAERAGRLCSLDAVLAASDGDTSLIELLPADAPDALEQLATDELLTRARHWHADEAAALEIAAEFGNRGLVAVTGKAAAPQLAAARDRIRRMALAAG